MMDVTYCTQQFIYRHCPATCTSTLIIYNTYNVFHHDPVFSFHLVVEEHVDDGVDDSAEFGQDGGHHTCQGSDQPRPTKRGQQRDDAIGHPAQHVAGHHGQHHHQNVLLSALSCQQIDFTHLEM